LQELVDEVVTLLHTWGTRGSKRIRVKGRMLQPTLVERRTGLWDREAQRWP
jgi:hypothetical protein